MNKDLTIGKPGKVLWQFCIPLFASVIFQQIYNIADSLIAGKFIGEGALAAVGNSYEITLIFIAVAFGCNIGCSVVISGYFGAKDYKSMMTAVATALSGGVVICALMVLLGTIFAGPLLRIIKTPAEIFEDSKIYLDIYIWGLPFMFFYNVATGIFSALGDSKTPFFFLAVSSTMNILVDILFVKYFKMGVAGVAWATFICQGLSAVLAVTVVFRKLGKLSDWKECRIFSLEQFAKISKIAIPSILQQSFISVGNIVIQRVINGFGPGVIAGYSASIKLNNLVITSFTTLGNGISNYTAQNMGAGKKKRIRPGFFAGIKMVWLICIPVVILYQLCGETFVRFFMDKPSREALHSGILFLRIVSPFYFIVSVKLVADGILRGNGMMKQFMAATFTDLILRVVLAIVFSGIWGYAGIWCAWPVGWTISMCISVCLYHNGPWKNCSLEK